MKKFIFVIIFFVISIPVFAIEIDTAFSQDVYSHYSDVYGTSIKIGMPIAYKQVSLIPWGKWQTWAQWSNNFLSADPFQDTYSLGIRIEAYNFYAEYSHSCDHEVVSRSNYHSSTTFIDSKNSEKKYSWNQAETMISFGYHVRTDWRPFE